MLVAFPLHVRIHLHQSGERRSDDAVRSVVRFRRSIATAHSTYLDEDLLKDEPMDELNKVLMTLASCNAGPGRIRQLRRETASRGLDPNVWFGNVERVVSERIGRETVQYVGNIYKYYVAYRLADDQVAARRQSMQP